MAFSADPTNPTNGRTDRPPMRASDDDRAATVRMLQDAVARGLLTPDEGGERMALAFAVVHLTDLGPLTADLPPAPIAVTTPGWRVLAMMAVEQLRSTLSRPGTTRLHPVRVAVAVVIALVLVAAVASFAGELLFDGGGRPGPGDFHFHPR